MLQEVHVLNSITWSPLATFAHPSVIKGPATVVVFAEEEEQAAGRSQPMVRWRWQPRLASLVRTDCLVCRCSGVTNAWSPPPAMQENIDPARSAVKTASKGGPATQRARQKLQAPARRVLRPSSPTKSKDNEDSLLPSTQYRYLVAELPVRLPVLTSPPDKPNPKLGVGECPARCVCTHTLFG